MIAIIDYGMGNLGSVEKAFAYIGFETVTTSSAAELAAAEAVVLPGVGAIRPAMEALHESGMDRAIVEYIQSGRPFLGICLGMQVLFDSSEEGGEVAGLGVIPGRVRRFPDCGLKVPQIGWNRIGDVRHPALTDGQYMYFVHSFYCEPSDPTAVAASTDYGLVYCSAAQKDNVLAVQFHPEKSGAQGLALLRSWAERRGF